MNKILLKKLNPIVNIDNYFPESHENYDKWIIKAIKLLPQYPEEVLKEYVYRHFSQFEIDCYELDIVKLNFEKTIFKLVVINIKYLDIIYSNMDMEEDIYPYYVYKNKSFYQRDGKEPVESWLIEYMFENKTFPTPVIIHNIKQLLNKYDIKKPLHILDGHNRYGILKAMIKSGVEVNKEHKFYISTF